MLPSIDSPQGDHVERIAPTAASPRPTPSRATSAPLICLLRGVRLDVLVASPQTGVPRMDPRGSEFLVGPTDPFRGSVGSSPSQRLRASVRQPAQLVIREGISQQRHDLSPTRRAALTVHLARRAVGAAQIAAALDAEAV